MATIRVLPDILASQVAAGEVVERPASVVKELVENSVDAGARELRVDIDQGGMGLIRVSDDGSGMSRDDALLSLERHATSKLRTASDLATIRTLGFRGEALPSIASVSRFRMVTREASSVAGTEIFVDGGKIRDVREAGCAAGTVMEVRALFYNIPARRKFLRAESTEAAHVEHQLRLHALAAPHVRFRFRRDDRLVFDLAPVVKALDRVRQLLGPELGRELIALPLTHGPGLSIEGFVLPALHARKGRRHQCVFLNGRPVEDAVISRALAEGFRGALADGLHPAAWLWMDLDPLFVDVNVHPAKREVRFHRPSDIRQAILDAVLAGLRPPPAVPPVLSNNNPPSAAAAPVTAAVPVAKRDGLPAPQAWLTSDWHPPASSGASDNDSLDGAENPVAPGMPAFRILGLLHHRFVVMESEDGLVLFDPKAAKERIYYDALLRARETAVASQGLLVPVLLEVDPRDHDLLVRERSGLAEAGLELEDFGGNTIQIRALPASLGIADPRPFLAGLLDELLHDPVAGPGRFAFERVARMLAKRAATCVEPRLAEARPLLEELFACDLPYCTAGGQPTLSEFGWRELEKRFGR